MCAEQLSRSLLNAELCGFLSAVFVSFPLPFQRCLSREENYAVLQLLHRLLVIFDVLHGPNILPGKSSLYSR